MSILVQLSAFSNPPTNLRCKVKLNPDPEYARWPLVEVKWEAPDFVPGNRRHDKTSYLIHSNNGIYVREEVAGFREEVALTDLDQEEVYSLSVSVLDHNGLAASAPALCIIRTVDRGDYYWVLYLVTIATFTNACS